VVDELTAMDGFPLFLSVFICNDFEGMIRCGSPPPYGASGGFLPAELAGNSRNVVALSFDEERPLNQTMLIWKQMATRYPSVDKSIRIAKGLYPHVEQ
jgi:hypothetical protein